MKRKTWMAFSIDRRSNTPVFEQICAAIRQQAANGELAEGQRMPPTRALSTELGVSRSTVVTAYEQLVAEGYLSGIRGSGYTICSLGNVELNSPRAVPVRALASENRQEVRPLQPGLPDMKLFPHRQWAKTVSRVARNRPESLLSHHSPLGNRSLREAIVAHLQEWRGIDVSAEQVIMTAGSGDALELCLRTMARRDDCIGLEDPGYLPLRHFVSAMGFDCVHLPIDAQGACIPKSTRQPAMVVLTPSHQYPLGGAMSPSRRLEFINWANKHQRWIIEDDYDSEFRYAGRPIPAMTGFDNNQRTIYIGSFSKIFSAGLRLGYLCPPMSLIDAMHDAMSQFGLRASTMSQQPLAEFIRSGDFYRHLRRMRRIYSERHQHMVQRLSAHFSPYGWFEDHNAGMQLTFHLSPEYPDTAISEQALAQGLVVYPLSRFCARQNPLNGLVLGFCAFKPEDIDTSLNTLRRVLAHHASG